MNIKHIDVAVICCIPRPDIKVHGADMGPIWGREDLCGPHVGPMNFAIWAVARQCLVGMFQVVCSLSFRYCHIVCSVKSNLLNQYWSIVLLFHHSKISSDSYLSVVNTLHADDLARIGSSTSTVTIVSNKTRQSTISVYIAFDALPTETACVFSAACFACRDKVNMYYQSEKLWHTKAMHLAIHSWLF